MAGIHKGPDLYTALNVLAITSLLDTDGSDPAIFADENVAPQSFKGNNYINFYMSEPYNPNLSYGHYARVIACHAKTQAQSMTMADTVRQTINREAITSGGRMYAEVLPTIEPANNKDVYNTPVNVIIKSE